MEIQSLSIVVPNKQCMNKCPFCVSRMVNSNIYPNLLDINHPMYDYNVKNYMDRLEYVAKCGCNTLMLTGTSEPQQNKQFLNTFAFIHKMIGSPFKNIEMQTTGMLLEDHNYLRFLKNFVGISTMALSINSPVDSENNAIIGHPNNGVCIANLAKILKDYGFNIRLCFNLSSYFLFDDAADFFNWCKNVLHADQVTFRQLYASDDDTEQRKWIVEHSFPARQQKNLSAYLKKWPVIGKTMYGMDKFNVMGMSVICDTDCMGKKPEAGVLKYLILRPNCHLYSQWDTSASLVF